MLTTAQLAAIAGRPECSLMTSVVVSLERFGAEITPPHRLAQYIAQLAHESGRFRHLQEIWGPTKAQRRYEGRLDLGNVVQSDGYKFRGRGPIQITGRSNYRRFTAWAHELDAGAPDFEVNPDALLADPWLGLAPIWYWQAGNPIGASLNRYADIGDTEMITRRINGGLNGYADRLDLYTKSGLALLGLDSVKAFQSHAGLTVDGIAGPKTRAAIHTSLKGA
uniref:peptidoglycan-binding protein n=1 Tax=Paenirhodobacter enshiensis TaxID=1105367 RepID=UPI0035AE00C4